MFESHSARRVLEYKVQLFQTTKTEAPGVINASIAKIFMYDSPLSLGAKKINPSLNPLNQLAWMSPSADAFIKVACTWDSFFSCKQLKLLLSIKHNGERRATRLDFSIRCSFSEGLFSGQHLLRLYNK